MRDFSSRSSLYRSACLLVTTLAVLGGAALGQASKTKPNQEPRAVGLIQVLPKGMAHLIPVVILVDGQYYDASAYKASPVPMALWAETEYEGFRTGISQGLFTVTAALENQKTNEWIAEGTWQTTESLAARSTRKPPSSVPRGLEDDSGPPVLRHSGAAKPKPPELAPPSTAVPQSPPAESAPSSPNTTTPPSTAVQSTSTPAKDPEQKDEQDPNRPTLKRGKPAPASQEETTPTTTTPSKPASHPPVISASAKTSQVQLIPAISDAGGPEPHSYIYDIKPEDDLVLRNKVLALAADEIRARVKRLASEQVGSNEAAHASKSRTAAHAKPVQPTFEGVQFRIFDLSSSNEPTMVLTASARMPAAHSETVNLQYFITLVARQDINGDIHKAFSNVTDTAHLDIEPRFELIDAVDVDGDGRAELLFQKVYDQGSAYVVYRVIGDQLYALFEGARG